MIWRLLHLWTWITVIKKKLQTNHWFYDNGKYNYLILHERISRSN